MVVRVMSQCLSIPQLNHEVMSKSVNWIANIDLAKFFDTMLYVKLLVVRSERIGDQKFLRLIARMLKTGI